MFEKATREKLRFDTPQGEVNVEDLWRLPLTSEKENRANLNQIAKDVSRALKQAEGEEDFVNPKPAAEDLNVLRLEIVKHIIRVRQEENAALRDAADKKARKDRIMELIVQKQDKELADKSVDELLQLASQL